MCRDRIGACGEPGHCMVYKLILPALVIAAFGDLMISVGMNFLGTESTRMSKWKKRCAALKGDCSSVPCRWSHLVFGLSHQQPVTLRSSVI